MDSKNVTSYRDDVKDTGIANILPDPVISDLVISLFDLVILGEFWEYCLPVVNLI
jgi:hypothetical protein